MTRRKTLHVGCIFATSIALSYGFNTFSSLTTTRRIREQQIKPSFLRFPFQLSASDEEIPFWMKEAAEEVVATKISHKKAKQAKESSTTIAESEPTGSLDSLGFELQGAIAEKAKEALDDTVDVSRRIKTMLVLDGSMSIMSFSHHSMSPVCVSSVKHLYRPCLCPRKWKRMFHQKLYKAR